MALFRCVGKSIDFVDSYYVKSASQTYTFPQNLSSCYVCVSTNDTATHGTYTGNGTMTTVRTNTSQVINYITNVSAGDKFKAPKYSVQENGRTNIFILGTT